MSRRATACFLAVYFAVLWGAVVVRSDRFPLTWAPMYSTYTPKQLINVRMLDKDRMREGLRVTRADGSQGFVTWHDLNIPKWNFWRLYGQRVKGRGPIKHKQGNTNLSAFNRWWRGLEEGEPNWEVDWPRRILRSVNHTLGLAPGDPAFIVRIEVLHHVLYFDKDSLAVEREDLVPRIVEWRESYGDRWGDGSL